MCIWESQVFTVEESRLLPNVRAVIITPRHALLPPLKHPLFPSASIFMAAIIIMPTSNYQYILLYMMCDGQNSHVYIMIKKLIKKLNEGILTFLKSTAKLMSGSRSFNVHPHCKQPMIPFLWIWDTVGALK